MTTTPHWRIAVIGAGAIGSTFALKLAASGHEVTMVVRNARRREALERDGLRGKPRRGAAERADVRVTASLDDNYDLVIVPVQRPQIESLVPALAANGSARIMFMFNNASDADRWVGEIGADRLVWGFPAILAKVSDETVGYSIVSRAVQVTTIGRPDGVIDEDLRSVGSVFSSAAIPTIVSPVIDGWLKTHAAFVAPMVAAAFLPGRSGSGPRLSWSSARELGAAVRSGMRAVRRSGATVAPGNMRAMPFVPGPVLTAMFWAMFATPAGKGMVSQVSDSVAAESAMLLDELSQLAEAAGVDPAPLARLAARIPAPVSR
ncbi:ketopantoate reductase family protein [Streptomyces sp. NPDC004561]